ncbi:sigma factor-like helix-turn-helix DNA-binding protein [Lysinibacillus capsici]|uniref:sigma factor-like helix-turn-helix DNA-binding protein n=1 Tax=Lysinibacillus capsici TaxID=2115968 RepID=UPI002E1FD1A1|nr:sigma factor-like helix-turn-helix DNA-binding protein [Lysinibacillus capsici]
MLIMESYADILKVIEIIKAEIEALQLDLDYWLGKHDRHLVFSEGARKYGLDVATKRVDFLYDRMEKVEARLKAYQEIEKEIRENVEKLDGLEYKIAKHRFIDGMTYQEIADQLGYTHDHIRRIASKSKKKEAALN